MKGGAEVVEQGIANIGDWLDSPFPEAWRLGIERARIASVLAQATENELLAKLQSELSFLVQLARSTASCCGVTSAYADAERLGVDRWLGLIAAYQQWGDAVVVIDSGTALKVDALDDAGRHIGGYIIPGAGLMERALLEGTDRVRYAEGAAVEGLELGSDTRSCVQHGVAAASVGAVLVAIEQCRLRLGRQPRLCVTGGCGALLKGDLERAGVANIHLEPDLVLDGLRWALP